MKFVSINIFCLGLALCSTSNVAWAFGKKKPSPPPAPVEPADTQAYPSRVVAFGKFLDTNFKLPDGKTDINMGVYLPQIVVTEMGKATNKLIPMGNTLAVDTEMSSPKDKFVFRGGITSFEASAFSGGIKFGYKAGVGDIGQGSIDGVTGAIRFTIGSLTMDFQVVDTERGEVVAVGTGSALTGDAKLEVDLNFSEIKTGADFAYKSPMAEVFRKAAKNAIVDMVNNPKTNFYMDWKSKVTALQSDAQAVVIGAGLRDDVQVNNVFTVYDHNGFRLGEVKIRRVDFEQSSATVKEDSSSAVFSSIRVGDGVRIFFNAVPR